MGYLKYGFQVEIYGRGTQTDWFETKAEAFKAFKAWKSMGVEPGETIRVIQILEQEGEENPASNRS